jgi:NAD(P)-dependent dehydrogenase (short-subunit alcohol dehydrogenase family)
MNSKQKSALIVGASRGLGFALVEELLRRGWDITATVRDEKKALLRAKQSLHIENVDINDEDQVTALKTRLGEKAFDLLFVAAGVANDRTEAIGEVSTEEFVRLMVTNSLSPMRLVERFSDNVQEGGTIGVMSSGQGSIADTEKGDNDVYRASKAALNMLMKTFAARRGNDYSLLLLAPGWIKTDMGGSNARFTVEETIGDIVDTIVAQEGKRGLQYLDRFGKPVNW